MEEVEGESSLLWLLSMPYLNQGSIHSIFLLLAEVLSTVKQHFLALG
jgi:hypothetical protein